MSTKLVVAQGDVSADHPHPAAHTPIPDPSALEGEGRRYREGHRHTSHAAGAAKRMRREPTLGEKVMWKALRRLDLHVRRQAPIGRYVADFAIHAAKLVVEVDGPVHDAPDQQLHDAERDAWLTSQGYRVLRFTTAEVLADADRVADHVERAALSPPSSALPPSRGKGER